MSQDTFSLYLQDALKQTEPQMLIFVFTRLVLDDNATAEQRLAFEQGEGGRLLPVSCAYRVPAELSDFNDLKSISGLIDKPWDVVFISSIIEPSSQQPVSGDVNQVLQGIFYFFASGQFQLFLALNQQGEQLSFD
jgi:hypothetical protein